MKTASQKGFAKVLSTKNPYFTGENNMLIPIETTTEVKEKPAHKQHTKKCKGCGKYKNTRKFHGEILCNSCIEEIKSRED